MKSTSLANHERYLAQETSRRNKIALEELRVMVYAEVKPIVAALITRAKDGDYKTAELLFDRTFGKVKDSLDVNVQFSLSSLAQQWEEQEKRKQEEQNSVIPLEVSNVLQNVAPVNSESSMPIS